MVVIRGALGRVKRHWQYGQNESAWEFIGTVSQYLHFNHILARTVQTASAIKDGVLNQETFCIHRSQGKENTEHMHMQREAERYNQNPGYHKARSPKTEQPAASDTSKSSEKANTMLEIRMIPITVSDSQASEQQSMHAVINSPMKPSQRLPSWKTSCPCGKGCFCYSLASQL